MTTSTCPLTESQVQCLEILQKLHERVKAGEIVRLAVVFEVIDGSMGHTWTTREDIYKFMGFMIATALEQGRFKTE